MISSNPARPKESVRFEMPDTVVLREVTPTVDAMKCSEDVMHGMSRCGPDGCFHEAMLQVLQPNPSLRSRMSYRMGSVNEMGRYKCLERSDRLDPTSEFLISSDLCDAEVIGAEFESPPSMEFMEGGPRFKFVVTLAGRWQATVVAVCEGCAGGGNNLISVLDFNVKVTKAWGVNNWQPPYAYYGDNDALDDRNTPPSELTGVTPLATFDMPVYPKVQIQCGRTSFRIRNGDVWDEEHLRIAYIDDFRAKKATCGQGDFQSIHFISQVTSKYTLRNFSSLLLYGDTTTKAGRREGGCEGEGGLAGDRDRDRVTTITSTLTALWIGTPAATYYERNKTRCPICPRALCSRT